MVYYINFTAPNNQLTFKRLLGYIWYHYSNMSVGVVRMIFIMILIRVCVGEINSKKWKYK